MAFLARIKSIALVAFCLSFNFLATEGAAIITGSPQECKLSFLDVNNQTCYFDIQDAPLGTFVDCTLYKDNNFLSRWSATSGLDSTNVLPLIFVHTKVPAQGSPTEFGTDVKFTINLYDGKGEKVIQNIVSSTSSQLAATNSQAIRYLNRSQKVALAFPKALYADGADALPDTCRTKQGVLFMYMWNVPATLDTHTPYKILLSTDSYRFFSWSNPFTIADGPVNRKASGFG